MSATASLLKLPMAAMRLVCIPMPTAEVFPKAVETDAVLMEVLWYQMRLASAVPRLVMHVSSEASVASMPYPEQKGCAALFSGSFTSYPPCARSLGKAVSAMYSAPGDVAVVLSPRVSVRNLRMVA